MRKFGFLLLFLFGFISYLIGQDEKTDSLLAVLEQHQTDGDLEEESNTVLEISNVYKTLPGDTFMLDLLDQSIAKFPEDFSVLKSELLIKKARLTFYPIGDREKALKIIEDLQPELSKTDDKEFKAKFWENASVIYINSASYEKGVEACKNSVNFLLDLPDNENRLMKMYTYLMVSYSNLFDYEKSLLFARKAIEVGKKSDNLKGVGDLYYNYSTILSDLERFDEEEDNLLKALNYYEKAENEGRIATVNNALARRHLINENYDLAIQYYTKSKATFTKLKNERFIQYTNEGLATAHFGNGNHKKGLDFLTEAIQFSESNSDWFALQGKYRLKAKFFLDISQPDSCIFYCQKEIENLQKIDSKREIEFSYSFMAQAEEMRGNYKQAYDYMQIYADLKDSLYTESLSEKLAEEETTQNLEGAVEAQENAELKAALSESRSQFFLLLMLGLLAILGIGSYLFYKLRKTRNQLADQNQQLKELNETKDKFFGIIAHDIRSPITALDGVGEQMNYYLEKNDQTKLTRLADRIDSTAKRLTALLDNLLNWALLQTGMIPYNPQSVDIQSVTEENIELFLPIAEAKNITLRNEINHTTRVFSDESALSAIIRNLLNNAIKFTSAGGEVTISTEEKNDKIFIKINDTGTGIAADKLAKIFSLEKRSSRGTSGERGSGLGLMLCKELVELNKGQISATSELGRGSEFVFSLQKAA